MRFLKSSRSLASAESIAAAARLDAISRRFRIGLPGGSDAERNTTLETTVTVSAHKRSGKSGGNRTRKKSPADNRKRG